MVPTETYPPARILDLSAFVIKGQKISKAIFSKIRRQRFDLRFESGLKKHTTLLHLRTEVRGDFNIHGTKKF